MKNMKISLGVSGLLLVLSASAQAETAWRFGISGARVNVEVDDALDDNATGWSVFAGFEFNKFVAVEAGYLDAGEVKEEVLPGGVVAADNSALFGSVLGSLPLGDSPASVFARAGVLSWKSDQEGRVEGDVVISGEADGTDPYFGAGVAATIDGALLRAEYAVAELDDSDITMIGLSIVWRF